MHSSHGSTVNRPLPEGEFSMPKLFYNHHTRKYVVLTAPAEQFQLYREWVDHCLATYPLVTARGLHVQFQKRDMFKRIGKEFNVRGGWFTSKWADEGNISICIGKITPIAEDEVMRTFFHQYGHVLQYDQKRYQNVPGEILEEDADAFADAAIWWCKLPIKMA